MANLTYPRQQALQTPQTLATVLHAILREQYGEEVYDWDPTTVYLEAKADFNADMCSEAIDRWSAIQVIMTSDACFKRLDAFMAVCNSLSDGSPFFTAFNPVTTEEAAWGIAEIALNREVLPFSYAVKQYLKAVLAKDGFDKGDYPDIFDEVFGAKPDTGRIREGLAAAGNDANIGTYIREQMGDLVTQFNRIPDLSNVDNIIAERGLEESLPGSN